MASVTFQVAQTNAANQISYTFSTLDFGAAASDRYIIVGCAMRKQDVADDIPNVTVTIGGVTATQTVMRQAAGEVDMASIHIANVPTGTTGDVIVDIGTFLASIGIGVWRTTGLTGTAANATASSTADDPTANLAVDANGIIVGVAFNAGAATTATWTGLTEGYDANVETNTHTGASLDSASTQTVSITANFAAPNAGTSSGAFASWDAAAVASSFIPSLLSLKVG